jgi:hypothetical protein
MLNGGFVYGYINAVHDAREGMTWCWSLYRPKPTPTELCLASTFALQLHFLAINLSRMGERQLLRGVASENSTERKPEFNSKLLSSGAAYRRTKKLVRLTGVGWAALELM